MISRFFLFLLLLMSSVLPVSAGQTVKARHYDVHVAMRSLSAKSGNPLDFAFVIRPEAGWHIYWSNPGESGYAPAFNWVLPAGMKAGTIRHPAPQLLMLGGIASNVHKGKTILLQSLSVPPTIQKNLPLAVDLDILVCSESRCVPDPLHLDMTVATGDGQIDATQSALFKKAEAGIPQPIKAKAHYLINQDKIRIFIPKITLAAKDKLRFFDSRNKEIMEGVAQTVALAEGGIIVTVSAGKAPLGKQVSGVLRIDGSDGMTRAYTFDASAATSLPTVVGRPALKITNSGFLLALGGAILGGLLLNLMPCVFPILSLKALALARSGGDDHEAKVEALGYSLGAITVILALGATLLLLRGGGQELGWAFQLQDTRVVILLLLLVSAIALNMAGIYELPTIGGNSRAKSGFIGSLSTGALAAFIATPCTGPFMAGALAAAMLLPAAAAMAIFFGLGVGLALPFLALGFIKPIRKWLPKPGAWMQKLRKILSIPMFATALGLAWIVGRQAGVDMMAAALGATLLLAMGLWWFGLRQFSGKRMWPVFVPIVAALFVSLSLVNVNSSISNAETTRNILNAVPFSKTRLSELRAAHVPVFLYMTADWCLSCKVNEATSLSSQSVATTFNKAGVTTMRGDWTKGNPKITAFLKEVGSAGVPLYLWYPIDGESKKLPQILTPSMLTGLIDPTQSDENL